jgi:cell division protein FtsI/penicillin-binding protein 2
MKAFTMAVALEEGKITPETTYIDTGEVRIGSHIIRNFDYRVFGKSTMADVLAKSINTGSVYAARLVGLEVFVNYLERFGFFDLTGIDLQGEITFSNQTLRQGREINLATASFGQGISVTPIQLARALAMIANQGRMVEPYIVKKDDRRMDYEQIISPNTTHQLTTMLVGNVEHRFGKKARIPGYHLAGKTGTAHIPWTALGYNKPGYSDELIHTFIGFAPAYSPQFLIVVKLDQPQGVRFASVSTAPIFQELSRYIINLWRIPPDY